MSDESLLKREEEQPALFLLPEAAEAALDRDGQYTAERLFLQRKETYKTIVHLLAQKQSIRAIKRACGVHHATITAVARREGIAIDTAKERVVGELRLAQTMLAESIVDAAVDGKFKPGELAMALGIVTDKIELLTGGATVRVETMEASEAPKTWDDWMKKVKGREITGSGVGESGAMAAGAPARVHALGVGDLPAAADREIQAGPLADSESTVSQGDGDLPTARATDEAANPPSGPAILEGGAGGLSSGGGPIPPHP